METYVLKLVLTSAIFIGFYFLVLERQKSHHFKRFYLLSSLVFSMLIPFLSITYGVEKPIQQDLVFVENSTQVVMIPTEEPTIFTTQNLIYAILFLGISIFLMRFIFSLIKLFKEINSGKRMNYKTFFLILKEEKITAHSFWKYIFLNRADYEGNKIDAKIILHEEAHISQKHSLDVLFMELVLVIFWFNPVFYFYKKAMVKNHEFLADEAVLSKENNISEYKKLLLSELISEKILFTHPFNLRNTKKRINMMTTPKNNKRKWINWLVLPLSAMVFFAFVEKVPKQSNNISSQKTKEASENLKATSAIPVDNSNETSVSQSISWSEAVKISGDPYAEFLTILSKYSSLLEDKKYLEFTNKVSEEDKKKLQELYFQLTPEQKKAQSLTFINIDKKLPKLSPAQSQLEDFKNSEKYGVWIDNKKVKNTILNNYKAEDFSQVFVSKVYKNARSTQNPQPFQVNLMTNNYYENYKKEKGGIVMGFKAADTTRQKAEKLEQEIKNRINKQISKESYKNSPPPPPPSFPHPKSKVKQNVAPIPPPPPVAEIKSETPPEFPGGFNALRMKFAENFNSSKIDKLSGTYKGVIYITVSEDGKRYETRYVFDDKIFEDASKETMEKILEGVVWKPGTLNGKNVASQLKFPITMNFE